MAALRRIFANDAFRRALRTFLQAFLAIFVLALIGWHEGLVEWVATGGEFPDVAILGRAAIAGVSAGVVALFSWVQNLLEDNTGMPALLKAPPSSGVNPMPEPADDGA